MICCCSLNIDSQGILVEDCNVNLFLETALRNREYTDFNDGLNTKVKLSLYKSFCKEIELLTGGRGSGYTVKFRSGTNGLNEVLG